MEKEPRLPPREIGKVKLTSQSELVLSEISKGKKRTGYYLNVHISSAYRSGYSKGVFVPLKVVPDLLSLFTQGDLELALASKSNQRSTGIVARHEKEEEGCQPKS